MEKSKVYFIKEVSPENVVRAYEALGVELKGNVAVKLHSRATRTSCAPIL